MTPLQLSLASLRKDGWLCQKTEHWNPFARVRNDLWGFADALCLRGKEILAVQATTTGNINKRVEKIKASENYQIVKDAGIRIEVWGWAKRGKRGERKLWQLKSIEL